MLRPEGSSGSPGTSVAKGGEENRSPGRPPERQTEKRTEKEESRHCTGKWYCQAIVADIVLANNCANEKVRPAKFQSSLPKVYPEVRSRKFSPNSQAKTSRTSKKNKGKTDRTPKKHVREAKPMEVPIKNRAKSTQ